MGLFSPDKTGGGLFGPASSGSNSPTQNPFLGSFSLGKTAQSTQAVPDSTTGSTYDTLNPFGNATVRPAFAKSNEQIQTNLGPIPALAYNIVERTKELPFKAMAILGADFSPTQYMNIPVDKSRLGFDGSGTQVDSTGIRTINQFDELQKKTNPQNSVFQTIINSVHAGFTTPVLDFLDMDAAANLFDSALKTGATSVFTSHAYQQADSLLNFPKTFEEANQARNALVKEFNPNVPGGNDTVARAANTALDVLEKQGFGLGSKIRKGIAEFSNKILNFGASPNTAEAVIPRQALPGTREVPGQAPAMGLSTRAVEPVTGSESPLTPEEIKSLKKQGVSDAVIQRIIATGAVKTTGVQTVDYRPSQPVTPSVVPQNAPGQAIPSNIGNTPPPVQNTGLPPKIGGEPPPSLGPTSAQTVVPDLVGERNLRITQTNQLAENLKRVLTLPEQEALTFYRDYKGNEAELAKLSADPKLAKYEPVIRLAQSPTPNMLTADKVISNYFQDTLKEGKSLDFLDSSISSDKYITHLLTPADQVKQGMFRGTSVGRNTPFSKARQFETVADAIKAGVKVKSINAIDALTIYGEKHAIAASTKLAINSLKESEIGKFGFRGADNIPHDWVPADPSGKFFRNTIPFKTPEGKLATAFQDLYVPPDVAAALKPLLSTDFTGDLPGFKQARLYQAYLKSIELGLSPFHLKALNITALNNEGITGLVNSYATSMKSPEFLAQEQAFVKAGGISPILGKTIDAYKGLVESSIPSRFDILKKATGIQAIDSFAKGITKLTFDITARKFKVTDFAKKNAAWIAKNPNASDAELLTAQRAIAKEVNATYGGFNWEILGWNKATVNISRFLALAPDWMFSNFFNAKYAFEGGPAGSAARKFWIRSAITGGIATFLTTLAITGKPQKANLTNFTQVNLGKDKNGKDIYQNLYFAGAPSDMISLMGNVADFGVIQGFVQTLASKLAPIPRTLIQVGTNKNYQGQDIVAKGMGPGVGDARLLYTLLVGSSPIPFSISNIANMMLDPKKQYTEAEYFTSLLGTRSRHVIPEGQRQVTSGSRKGQLVPATPSTPRPFWEQVTTGKINQPKKKGGGLFGP